MQENAVVRARINADIKTKASDVLNNIGLTISDVIRLVLTRVANEESLPFDLVPNSVTMEAIERCERGKEVHKAQDIDDLFEQLEI